MEEDTDSSHWNPIKASYNSILNTFHLNKYRSTLNRTSKTPESLCPFPIEDQESGKCYKGSRCVYPRHSPFSSAQIAENYKLGIGVEEEKIAHLNHLQVQERIPSGVTNLAKIICAVSPWEFYVVPYSNWDCSCEKLSSCSLLKKPNARDFEGLEELDLLTKNLSKISKSIEENPSVAFTTNQLVMVNLKNNGTPNWYRGVVLEEPAEISTDEDAAIFCISLKLLDYGIKISTSSLNVRPLPSAFVHIPPLALHCSLYGVSPLSHRWSKEAIGVFKDLVDEKDVLVEIATTAASSNLPHLVHLTVLEKESFKRVGDELLSRFLALEWNSVPMRPKAHGLIHSTFLRDFLIMNKKDSRNIPLLPPQVYQREQSRLETLIEKININKQAKN